MSARHPDEVRAAAMAALLAGQAVSEISRDYNIPIPTIKSWKLRDAKALAGAQDATKKRPDLTEKILVYLNELLTTLAAQQRVFRETEWLRKQPANELAVLHGVSADKGIRLLEALQASGLVNDESGCANA